MSRLAGAEVARDRYAVHSGGLAAFARLAWPHIDPAPLRWSWHHELICERLERVSRGETRRLLVMVPPGTTKTLLVSLLWPVWHSISEPSAKYIVGSYGSICLDAARQHRDLVCDPWFAARWPGLEVPYQSRAASYFRNAAGGYRFSTSVRGPLTGRHADIHIGDDLNKAQDAVGGAGYTETALDDAWLWWTQILPTRQVDPTRTRRVLIAQRLHERDVPGRWLDADPTLDVLCLPMRYSSAHPYVCEDDPRAEGELLWPEHISEDEVAALERVLGPVQSSAQLQQLPVPAGGAVFASEWIRHYHHAPQTGRTIQSWDMAFRGGTGADHVVGQVWRRSGETACILDAVRGQWDFPTTVDRLINLTLTWPDSAREVLIENKANGPAIEAELRRSYRERCKARGVADPPTLTIRLVEPQGGKLARAHAVTGIMSAGNVEFPQSAPWLAPLLAEVMRFSGRGAEQDDQVDAMTQALTYLYGSQQTRWAEAMERYRRQRVA